MKLTFTLGIAGLLCLAVGDIVYSNFTNVSLSNSSSLQIGSTEQTVHVTTNDGDLWHRATCRGNRLLLGTTLNPDQAALHVTPLTTPWHGTLVNEMATWGYSDDSDNPRRIDDCDFTISGDLQRVFEGLRLDPRNSRQGGPNHCFTIVHYSGPAVERNRDGSMPPLSEQHYVVNGRRYRVTGALFTIGINAGDGIIYLVQRESPEHEARKLWEVPEEVPIPRDQLPALRSSSDIAWGLWNRMSAHNLGNINAFMSITVINADTGDIIDKALEKRGIYSVPAWPGYSFHSGSEEYSALLGSPNGLAVGYFLTQHKREIGGNKYVSEIVVFREDDETSWPYLLFYVDWAPPPPPPPPPPPASHSQDKRMEGEADNLQQKSRSQHETKRVLNKSSDGKHVMREHVIWAE